MKIALELEDDGLDMELTQLSSSGAKKRKEAPGSDVAWKKKQPTFFGWRKTTKLDGTADGDKRWNFKMQDEAGEALSSCSYKSSAVVGARRYRRLTRTRS